MVVGRGVSIYVTRKLTVHCIVLLLDEAFVLISLREWDVQRSEIKLRLKFASHASEIRILFLYIQPANFSGFGLWQQGKRRD